MLNRRHFLALGGVAGGALLLPASHMAGASRTDAAPHLHAHGGHVGPSRPIRSASVDPFQVRMPLTRVLSPAWSGPDLDVYRLDIRQTTAEILPGLSTQALGYNGQFIGPTIRTRAGRRVKVLYRNQLTEPANVHLHGGHVAAEHDGHPMDVIDPNQVRYYDYPNRQQGATLWYHDHSHHTEALHVHLGLHGFYLIDDPEELHLGLPSGPFDVPILLRDAHFDENGQFVLGDPAERRTFLANGKPAPYFPVAARKYRLRLLNAATERVFRLNLGGAQMIQIGSDGGLLPAPVVNTELVIGSGERVDIVVDFKRFQLGSQVVLADATGGPVLRFDVERTASDFSRVPDRLRPLPPLPPATVTREVVLSFDLSAFPPVGLINGKTYDPNRTDFRVKRGATEIWRVVNADPLDHNFHMHLAQFRVLEREGEALWPQDVGRKDTVTVPVGKAVKVQATFEDFLGKYAYHCHFLEHSSLGMMAQMEVVP
jgi:spore coat protein A, manganese oxidase